MQGKGSRCPLRTIYEYNCYILFWESMIFFFLWEVPLVIQKPEYDGYMYVKILFYIILQIHYDQF